MSAARYQGQVFPEVDPPIIGPAHEFYAGNERVWEKAHDSVEELGEFDYMGRDHAVPVSGDAIARFREAMLEGEAYD